MPYILFLRNIDDYKVNLLSFFLNFTQGGYFSTLLAVTKDNDCFVCVCVGKSRYHFELYFWNHAWCSLSLCSVKEMLSLRRCFLGTEYFQNIQWLDHGWISVDVKPKWLHWPVYFHPQYKSSQSKISRMFTKVLDV